VEVATAPVRVDDLAEQQRPPVAEARRVPAELVTGVGLRDRRRAIGHGVPDQDVDPVLRAERVRVEAQLAGELLVEREQPRRRHGRPLPRDVEPLEPAHEGVVEGERRPGDDTHVKRGYRAGAVGGRSASTSFSPRSRP
jgi:hypothetical protein